MEVTNTCPFCHIPHTLEIDVEPEQLTMWENGMLIQEAMPHLTVDEREHIKTGICSSCWEELG